MTPKVFLKIGIGFISVIMLVKIFFEELRYDIYKK